jgi:hypothetical protein
MNLKGYSNTVRIILMSLLFSATELLAGNVAWEDSLKNRNNFWWLTFGHQDRAADFEENLFKDPQLIFNTSIIHSSYDLSPYFTDEWLLNENDFNLTGQSSLNDPSRKFSRTRLSLEMTGSFLFFYGGLGMVLPGTFQQIELGSGTTYYTEENTRYFAEIRKSGYWKAGFNLHFRRWVLCAGLRGYPGVFGNSRVKAQKTKTGEIYTMSGPGSSVFNNFLELGIRYQNFTLGFERALNIDFSGAECNSISIGYNLFDLRNFNEKRIPR